MANIVLSQSSKEYLVGVFKRRFNCNKVLQIKAHDIDFNEWDMTVTAVLYKGNKRIGKRSMYTLFTDKIIFEMVE